MESGILLASFQCHRTSNGLELGYSMDETNLSADYDIFRICPSEDKQYTYSAPNLSELRNFTVIPGRVILWTNFQNN
jgi:hypothetical protein